MREGKYWIKEGKRLCRVCGWEEERWKHVLWWCRRGEEGLDKMKENTGKSEGNCGWKSNRGEVDEKARRGEK